MYYHEYETTEDDAALIKPCAICGQRAGYYLHSIPRPKSE